MPDCNDRDKAKIHQEKSTNQPWCALAQLGTNTVLYSEEYSTAGGCLAGSPEGVVTGSGARQGVAPRCQGAALLAAASVHEPRPPCLGGGIARLEEAPNLMFVHVRWVLLAAE